MKKLIASAVLAAAALVASPTIRTNASKLEVNACGLAFAVTSDCCTGSITYSNGKYTCSGSWVTCTTTPAPAPAPK